MQTALAMLPCILSKEFDKCDKSNSSRKLKASLADNQISFYNILLSIP